MYWVPAARGVYETGPNVLVPASWISVGELQFTCVDRFKWMVRPAGTALPTEFGSPGSAASNPDKLADEPKATEELLSASDKVVSTFTFGSNCVVALKPEIDPVATTS